MAALGKVEDTGRIVQKFLLGRGDVNDLLAINTTIRTWSAIIKRIEDEKQLEALERSNFNSEEWGTLDMLMSRMSDLYDLSQRIGSALELGQYIGGGQQSGDELEETSPTMWKYGTNKWVIRPE